MARDTATVERLKGGVDKFVSKAVDATVHLPLGIYDRTREQLADVDAKRLRKTFEGLIGDFIDRGQDRVQPFERRLKREGRKAEAELSEAVDEAQRSTRTVKKAAKDTAKRAQKTTQQTAHKTARKTAERTSAPKPQRGVAAPRIASELPIENYGSLTADEIVSRLSGQTQTDLSKVYKFEKAHENRATVLNAIESKFVTLPIPSYDAFTVDEIVDRLEKLDDSKLKAVKRYESATKMRSTVLEKIDSLLS
jgi:hypothetical protein